jgi:hypothetical protein
MSYSPAFHVLLKGYGGALLQDSILTKGLLSSAKDSILTKGLRPYKRTSSLQKDFVLTKGLLSSAKD